VEIVLIFINGGNQEFTWQMKLLMYSNRADLKNWNQSLIILLHILSRTK